MVRKDKEAADLIRRLRVDRGLSPEALSVAIRDRAVQAGMSAAKVSVSGDTIRLIERTYREPTERVKFAVAFYFDLRPGHIWKRDQLMDMRTGEAA